VGRLQEDLLLQLEASTTSKRGFGVWQGENIYVSLTFAFFAFTEYFVVTVTRGIDFKGRWFDQWNFEILNRRNSVLFFVSHNSDREAMKIQPTSWMFVYYETRFAASEEFGRIHRFHDTSGKTGEVSCNSTRRFRYSLKNVR